jgi:ribosome-associated protein
MNQIKFEIEGEFIELIKLIKACGIAENGGEAKQIVKDGNVFVNNLIELQMRKKIKKGDTIKVFNQTILVQ